eukprot:TRINITY_DN8532_c0_g1_i4.p1 TRINITY_DN8532_c0_g1~~TRINITY_DN8532_c0_g1_i4.p1  ORF type:complete len:230 (+),score=81.84 TRINITY_DN8532_c0_g1_i4:72-761(+)
MCIRDRSKGIAFVRFGDEKSLNSALEYNGAEFMGRSLKIEKSTPKGQKGGAGGSRAQKDTSTVFVGNLSFNTTKDSLMNFFSSCGKVNDARIITTVEGESRGFGYVEFAGAESIEKAVLKAGEKIDGRAIKVDYANARSGGAGGSGGDRNGGGRGGFGGGNRGGFGGGQGGYGGGQGGFGGNRGGSGGFGGGQRGGFGSGPGARVQLDDVDKAAKKGAILPFEGTKKKL